MQTYLDCYPCILRQAIEAARMAGASQSQQRAVVSQTLEILKHIRSGVTPPEIAGEVHQRVREITGVDDPYLQVKRTATDQALEMLPELRGLVNESDDPLDAALRLSIAGNVIDLGPNKAYDLWDEVQRALTQSYAIDDSPILRRLLQSADSVLFLGDNAGETVFDRLLIETLSVPVTYVVRGGAVLNDATLEDAHAAGIGQVAEVIDHGARIPGTRLSMCKPEFQERFYKADLILAKGMGNYETLSAEEAPLFFLLKVKCPIIGSDIGVPVGNIVIKGGKRIER